MLVIQGCWNNLPGCGTALFSVQDKHTQINEIHCPNAYILQLISIDAREPGYPETCNFLFQPKAMHTLYIRSKGSAIV